MFSRRIIGTHASVGKPILCSVSSAYHCEAVPNLVWDENNPENKASEQTAAAAIETVVTRTHREKCKCLEVSVDFCDVHCTMYIHT